VHWLASLATEGLIKRLSMTYAGYNQGVEAERERIMLLIIALFENSKEKGWVTLYDLNELMKNIDKPNNKS